MDAKRELDNVLTTVQVSQYNQDMESRRTSSKKEPRISRTYRLPLTKLVAARRALGASTDTETIERALDLVVLGEKLAAGTEAMFGIDIVSPDPKR